MKVILKGISHSSYNEENYSEYHVNLLKQISYPVIVEADKYPGWIGVNLRNYIVDEKYPDSSEEWGLLWFDYEEIQE